MTTECTVAASEEFFLDLKKGTFAPNFFAKLLIFLLSVETITSLNNLLLSAVFIDQYINGFLKKNFKFLFFILLLPDLAGMTQILF